MNSLNHVYRIKKVGGELDEIYKKYHFAKPEGKDKCDINDQNENWEKIEKINRRQQKRTAVLSAMQFLIDGIVIFILRKELVFLLLQLSDGFSRLLQKILKELK